MKLIPILLLFSIACSGQSTTIDFMRRANQPAQQVTYSGSTKLSAFMPVNPFYTFTCIKSNGMFYFGAMGLEAQLRNPYMLRYNPTTNTVDQELKINVSGVVTYDIHRMPTIAQDGSARLYMVAEDLQTPANGGHASPIRMYRTSTAGDITTFSLFSTVTTDRFAYPHLYIDRNNIFYVFARGTNSTFNFIRGQYWMFKSLNKGTTWTSLKIYDSGDEQKVAYFQRIHDYSDAGLYLVLNERDNDNFNYTYVAIIKSLDGGTTWTNLSGSFSKNVSSSGALTRTELRTNCMVYDSPAPTTKGVNFEGGVVKSNGVVKMLLSPQTKTGNSIPTTGVEEITLDELRLYTFSGGSWTYNNVSFPANQTFYWAGDKPTRYINGNQTYDDIVVIDVNTRNVFLKRSSDNFATSTSTQILSGSGHNYRMGDIAFNATNEQDYILIIADPIGDPLLWQNESTTNYTNLLIYRPATN